MQEDCLNHIKETNARFTYLTGEEINYNGS